MGHVLRYIRYGLDFSDHTYELISKLCDRIHLPYSMLDFSEKSLDLVDEAAGKIYYNTEDDDEPIIKGISLEIPPPEMIGEIVAFVGEVIIHEFDGAWCVAPVEGEDGVFEPYVRIRSGDYHFAYRTANMILSLDARVSTKYVYGEMYSISK